MPNDEVIVVTPPKKQQKSVPAKQPNQDKPAKKAK
jgi:hypothetical protein